MKLETEAAGLQPRVGNEAPGAEREGEERLRRIIGRVALRDPAALAQLYDATVGRVYGLAVRMLKDNASAEEVVSDVYLQVWRTASTYQLERGGVVTWLLVICRSRALDSLRASRERIVYQDLVDAGEAADPVQDPQDILAATQRSSSVHAALSALAPLPRQLIALAFFRGYTHQEIATSTGLPLGTVKSHIRRALDHLRARTSDCDET